MDAGIKASPLRQPSAHEISDGQIQFRKIPVPAHRYTPLKKAWLEIYTPIYEEMKIDIRMNLTDRQVELETRSETPKVSNLQKSADFVHAFTLGFDAIDAAALLRTDALHVGSFEIEDAKTLRGENLSGAIEESTMTRIVIDDMKIHILGSLVNIMVARDSICSLIMDSPGYSNM